MLSRQKQKNPHGSPCGFFTADKCILLLVALGAILGREGFTALLVAGAAGLARVDVRHGDGVATLLHLEDTGMAICALEALVSVGLAVEHNLAGTLALELHRLAGRNREGRDSQDERNHYNERDHKELFH